MAFSIFLIGAVLGWFVRPPNRAAAVTVAVGLALLILYLVLGWVADLVVSPLETIVLLLGTPLAAVLAFRVARWRASRQTIRD